MIAEEIMTSQVTSVPSDSSVLKAFQILAELNVRHLPVVDDGELVGMLSDRDLRELGVHRLFDPDQGEAAEALQRLAVADVMSADVVTIEPTTTLREIVDCMIDAKVGALPVTDGHTAALLGIVSYVDVLRAVAPLVGA
jgi:acetoin utilization protein AcuB